MIISSKIATMALWLAVIINWIVPTAFSGLSPSLYSILHWSGIFLAVAHTVETAVYLPKAKKLGGNVTMHAVQLFLFGYPHVMQIEQDLKTKSGN